MPDLPSLDWIGDPARLRAQALAELATAGKLSQDNRLQGADSSSSVSIEVDARRRVKGVSIGLRWRAKLQPGRVGAAILEAYRNAAGAAVESRMVQSILDDEEREDAPASAPAARPASGERQVPGSGLGDEGWLRSVQDTIALLAGQLAAYSQMASQDAPPEPTTEVTSPNGLFTMRHRGATVLGIAGDVARIQEADTELLRSEAYDLFRAAGLTSG
jgi:hypothetical protein